MLNADPTIAPIVDTFWLYGSQFRYGDQRIQQAMTELWTSPVLPEILDRLISLNTFAFEIDNRTLTPKIYFQWDTLGRAMQSSIKRLISRPSITNLKLALTFALPVDVITSAPNLAYLHVECMDDFTPSSTTLTELSSGSLHRVLWSVKHLRAEWYCQKFVSTLLPAVEDRLTWKMCHPQATTAILYRSRHPLKDLFLEFSENDLYSDSLDPRLCHYKSLVTLRLGVLHLEASTFRTITTFLNLQFEHPFPSTTYLQMQIRAFGSYHFQSCMIFSRLPSFEAVLRASFPRLKKLVFEVDDELPPVLAEQFEAFIKWVFPVTTATDSTVQVLLRFDLIINPRKVKKRHEVDMKGVDVDVQAYIFKVFGERV